MKQCIVLIFLVFPFLNSPTGSRGDELFRSAAQQQKNGFSPCINEEDCDNFQNAICVDNFCECNGTKFCQDKMETKVTKLGQTCKTRGDCIIEHSVCVQEKCQCEQGRVGSEDGRRCFKASDEPCIDSLLCNELDSEPKPEQCRVGRCECPEERPYCTNQAADTRSNRPIKEAPNKQSAKEKIVLEAAPEEGPNPFSFFQGDLYTAQSDSDSHRQGQSIDPSDQEELEALYTYTCYVTIYVLLMSSLLLVAFSKNRTRRFFSKYVLPFYGLVIVLCAMWIVNLRDEMFTVIVLVVLGGTSCALLNISYRIINDILNEGGRRLIEEGRSEDGPDEAQAEPEGRRRLSMRSRRRRHR